MISDLSTRRDFTGIDVCKFVMAFAVIGIHCRHEGVVGPREWPWLMAWILGLAVSFFFTASGFLVARSVCMGASGRIEQKSMLRKRALNLFRIYACWLIVYLPIAVYSYVADDVVWWKAIAGYLYKMVISGHSNWAWQLWFVYSMAVVFLIYTFTSFTRSTNIVMFGAFLLVSLLNLCYTDCSITTLAPFYILTHSVLGGGICISVGILLYQYFNKIHVGATIVICFALSIALKMMDVKYFEFFGGIALFLTALSINPKSNNMFRLMRRLSMWIYYLHMIVVFTVYQTIMHDDFHPTLWQVMAIDSILTLALAYVVVYFQQNIPSLKILSKLIK